MTTGTTGGPLTLTVTQQEKVVTPTGTSYHPYTGVVAHKPTRSWDSTPTAGFHRMVRKGELLPHTAYATSEEVVTACAGSWSYYRSSDKVSASSSGGMSLGAFNTTGWPDEPQSTFDVRSLQHQAASSFMSKCQYDAGTSLAEIMKIGSIYKGMIGSFQSIMEHGVRRAETVSDLMDFWLSARYGLRPLISEVQSFNKALESQRKGGGKVFTASKATATEAISNLTTPVTYYGYPYTRTYRWSQQGTRSFQFNISGVLTPYRVLFDPAKTAWEIIPYSFVLDWFLSVGNWIDSVRLAESGLAYTASLSTKTDWTDTLIYTAVPDSGISGFYQAQKSRDRSIISRTPMVIDVDAPVMQDNFGGLKVLDALALAMQPITRHAQKRWNYVPFAHPYTWL